MTANAFLQIFRRGYYAAVSYTDFNIGKMLASLKELGFEDNTVVIVFGDHGWQLGEHDTWAKMTNFEVCRGAPSFFSFISFLPCFGYEAVPTNLPLIYQQLASTRGHGRNPIVSYSHAALPALDRWRCAPR